MKLDIDTFVRVGLIARAINPQCDNVGYEGAGDGYVTFACRHPKDRCGFYLDVDEAFEVLNVRPLWFVATRRDQTYYVTLWIDGRTVDRPTSCQRCGKSTMFGHSYCSKCRSELSKQR